MMSNIRLKAEHNDMAHAIKRNQLIGITGLSKHFTKIFNMLGITKFAKIHDNVQTAVDALNA